MHELQEAVILSGTVEKPAKQVGRELFVIHSMTNGWGADYTLADRALSVECSGEVLHHSPQISEEDLEWLFDLPIGTQVELVLRRKRGG